MYLVDDHEVVREGLRVMLQKDSGITFVGDTADAAQAIEEVRQLDPDVVILDIRLQGSSLDGFEIARQIKASTPDKPIIMLTGYDSELYMAEALRTDVSGFITKERSRRVLSAAIKLAAEGITVWDRRLLNRAVKYISKHAERQITDTESAIGFGEELTDKEQDVLRFLEKGYSNKDICKELHFSDASVKKHVHNCMKKLGAENRTQTALIARQRNLI